MMSYINLSLQSRVLFAICMMILTLGALFLLIGACILYLGRHSLGSSALLLSAVLFVFQGIAEAESHLQEPLNALSFCGMIVGGLPWVGVIFLLVLLALAEGILLAAFFRRRKQSLTARAIKESLDTLPDGICFSGEDGQPLLLNEQMNRISVELFNSELVNVKLFRRFLEEKKSVHGTVIRTEPTVIVETAGGKVWDFHHCMLNVDRSNIDEMIAYDITEQYQLSRELEQRNERLNRVNERLRRFSEEMVNFTAEKEPLDAKIKVHDNIGRALLACRTYLLQKPENRSRRELLFLWQYVFSVMKKEAAPAGEWDLLERAADMLHVRIRLTGELPENLKQRTAIVTAIRECLTNTASHAGGDQLFVHVRSDETAVTAELTNTGKTPEGEIQENGGLKNLRHIVERAEGTMVIESAPRFLLRLEFQKRRQ